MRLSSQLSILGLATALLSAPAPAFAFGAEYCVNCATQVSQIASMAKQAAQYALQAQQYASDLQRYAIMAQNTVALPMEAWANVQSDIMGVRNLANGASLLSGNSASLISRLNSATAFTGQISNVADMPAQLLMYRQTLGNSLNTMGRTLGLQQSQEMSNAALLAALQRQSESAGGQMQAIQAGNELAGQTNAQLIEIQSTLSTTAQMEATNLAVEANRRASEDAALTQFTSSPLPSNSGNPQY